MTNGFVAGTAPDVFTNHLSKYPEFVTQGQLVSLDDQLAADGVKTDIYQKGLADLWVGQDGKRYGLPKDFDTVAIFYNKKLIKDAGVNEADLANLTWNPTDGGTYEKMIAHLTVDANGKRGDEAGFDKTKVKVYGLGLDGGSGGGNGQTQWSMYTGTTSWTVTDKNPWGTKYNYDKPEFQSTIAWMRPPDREGLHALGRGRHRPELRRHLRRRQVRHDHQRLLDDQPDVQLQGRRDRPRPDPHRPQRQALQHVQRPGRLDLGGLEEQGQRHQVGRVPRLRGLPGHRRQGGVVFPAIPSGTDARAGGLQGQGHRRRGSSFFVHVKDGTTFLFPITDNASQVTNIMQPAVDAVMTGKAKADSLTAANEQVNQLFAG